MTDASWRLAEWVAPNGVRAVEMSSDEHNDGPWGVYDAYCLSCAYRYVSVAPIVAEDVALWECPTCRAMSVQATPYPDEDDGGEGDTP